MAAIPIKIIIQALPILLNSAGSLAQGISSIASKFSKNKKGSSTQDIEELRADVEVLREAVGEFSSFIKVQEELQTKLVELNMAIDKRDKFQSKIIFLLTIFVIANTAAIIYLATR